MPDLKERLRRIRHFRTGLLERVSEWTAAARADLAKTDQETLGGDILPLAEACRFLESQGPTILAPRKIRSSPFWIGDKQTVYRVPWGTVGVIGTWNYPFFLCGVQILQALAAGNRVIWKPSEMAPQSAKALITALRAAGWSEQELLVLPVNRIWGRHLCEADLDFLVFTGAESTGRAIASGLGQRLIPSILELSGHDPMIVFEDVTEPLLATKAAWFGLVTNNSQICIAPRRLFVQKRVYEAVLEPLRQKVAQSTPRPLVIAAEKTKALERIAQAQAAGAVVHSGPMGSDPNQMAPILVETKRPDLAIALEACFCPVVVAQPFESETELKSLIGSGNGLGASVFTSEPEKGERMRRFLPAGQVSVNDVVIPFAHPDSPFGGIGSSGWGATQGREGLLAMTRPQMVSHKVGNFRPHLAATWTGQDQTGALTALLRIGHAPTWSGQVRGFWDLMRFGLRHRKDL